MQILNDSPELAKHFSLILYDNSAQPQRPEIATSYPVCYIHDPSNGGLVSAYNFALQRAESEEREWLLLLDQDTSLTPEFVLELVRATGSLQSRSEVAAIVPKLQVNGRIDSPAADFFDQMRRQFLRPEQAITQATVGIQEQSLCSYNSGSALRVTALRSIGGFPSEFWLDFLDHAVFHALFLNGSPSVRCCSRQTGAPTPPIPTSAALPVLALYATLFWLGPSMCKRSGSFIDQHIFTASGCYATAEIFANPAKTQPFGGRHCGKRWANDSGARKDKRLLT